MTRILFNVLGGVLIFILIQVAHLIILVHICLCAAPACHSFKDGSDTNLNSLGIAFLLASRAENQRLFIEMKLE